MYIYTNNKIDNDNNNNGKDEWFPMTNPQTTY